MNVAVSVIANDPGTDAVAVQTTVTLFTLTLLSGFLGDVFGRMEAGRDGQADVGGPLPRGAGTTALTARWSRRES